MNSDQLSFFRLASDRMEWLSARQKVIAENIANGDTPGYRARDVAPFENYVQTVSEAAGARGVSGEQGGAASFSDAMPVDTVDSPDSWSGNLSGNTVVLEQQTVKAGETAVQYRLAANLYRKAHDLLNIAASEGK
ncbi:flagellar basal body rod protein FlgB [Acidimangrovimonas sediminis]|uniref:flagellar basal body rod protein FlgB n=1 Tax=Acidimangrovimonas sediminis TaxID=2056283 RepID=UPI000C808FC2|nr:flagellar basal body protein [Acidimangrovimonas sediminis]